MKSVFFQLILVFFFSNSNAQIITTVAGCGSCISLGDHGPATAAQTGLPVCGSFDGDGNYYFWHNSSACRIRKINPSGIITTVAGTGTNGYSGDGGPATAAQIQTQVVETDVLGNIYFTDRWHNVIRKIDHISGVISTIAGTGTISFSGAGSPASATSLQPLGICCDSYSNLYVCANGYVLKIDAVTGIVSIVGGDGIGGFSGDGGPATAAGISCNNVSIDEHRNLLYVSGGTRIRKINLITGIITSAAGTGAVAYNGENIPATSANFRELGIGVDDTGSLYIADDYNDRIRKVDTFGFIHTCAGNGIGGFSGDGMSALSAQILNPQGVSFNPCGNLYIADESNNRIRKVTFNPLGIAAVSIAVSPNDTVCAGTPVTYTATTTGSSTTGYSWYRNGVVVPGATGSTYTYTPTETADSIRCVYAGVDICGISAMPISNTIHMTVLPLSAPVISLSAPTSSPIGSIVFVNATLTGAGSSYSIKWFKNSVQFFTSTTSIATYTKAAGTDVITATVSSTDVNGCYDTTTSPPVSVSVGTGDVDPITGNTEQIILHPNPAKKQIVISNLSGISNVVITDVPGKQLINCVIKSSANGTEIDIEKLPAGVYFLHITDKACNKFFSKFNKE